MSPKGEMLVLAALCVVVVLCSLGGLVWFFVLGLSLGGVDPLMVLLICLMMGGVFSLQLYSLAKTAGWLESVKLFRRKAPTAAPAESSAQDPK